MGKASKWIKNLLTGKKSSSHQAVLVDSQQYPKTPVSESMASAKDKRRWSFRKPSSTTETYLDAISNVKITVEAEDEQKRRALAVAVANAAAADAAAKAANEAVMRLTCSSSPWTATTLVKNIAVAAEGSAQPADEAVRRLTCTSHRVATSVEDTAATKIQSVFRSYLARKALFALKGLVKLQALVRGHLVRKQATATFRCLQALLTVQARARARRIKMINEPNPYNPEVINDDHIKIVEMDIGVPRGRAKNIIGYFNNKPTDNRYSTYQHQYSKQNHQQISPAPSAITDMSSKSKSGHFNDFFHKTSYRSPQYNPSMDNYKPHQSKVHFSYKQENDRCYDYQFSPNYMADTKSSKARLRSQSAPKQRPADTFQRQPSRRRVSLEGKNLQRAVRMERSSSLVCSTPQNYHPWSELDQSAISMKDSECGSNSTLLTNCRHYRF
ncbi:hypothetical protein DCAR_0832306 [Daucus carota subsp. sativus]|uniref:DUF4005 domain-containing protein n=1 Tax=Daucus carota subsp. sativus TaxID=79200 RepID=A0AAF0XR97_DAUCS|nr:hypothetical protein DCAR_0832306 [Daucus carota subsp. sativus]